MYDFFLNCLWLFLSVIVIGAILLAVAFVVGLSVHLVKAGKTEKRNKKGGR